jgi:hypothetical protein
MKSDFLKQVILSSFLMITCTFFSCEKQSDDSTSIDNYYVKYIVYGNGAYGRFSNWTATTPDGKYSNSGYQTKSWTQTYGPVKKGFKCAVQVGNYISGAPTIEIHVSKNAEPFALKVTKIGNSASYSISF